MALSAVEEIRLERELRVEFAEEVIKDAVRAWQQHMEATEKERRACLARQKEAEMESERRQEVEQQTREKLRPEASACRPSPGEAGGALCVGHDPHRQDRLLRRRSHGPVHHQ